MPRTPLGECAPLGVRPIPILCCLSGQAAAAGGALTMLGGGSLAHSLARVGLSVSSTTALPSGASPRFVRLRWPARDYHLFPNDYFSIILKPHQSVCPRKQKQPPKTKKKTNKLP